MKSVMRSESPFVTRPETTYKSGKVVQTNETTSISAHSGAPGGRFKRPVLLTGPVNSA